MTTGNHIPIQIHQPPKSVKRSNVLRFNENTESSEIARELEKFSRDFIDLQNKVNELIKYQEDNKFKLNNLIKTIERTQQSSASSVITQIDNSSSGSGSSSATDDIVTVSKSLTGGVASAEVFSAPAQLLSVPILYKTVEGLLSFEVLNPVGLTVAGFSITSQEDGTVIYSYKLL